MQIHPVSYLIYISALDTVMVAWSLLYSRHSGGNTEVVDGLGLLCLALAPKAMVVLS